MFSELLQNVNQKYFIEAVDAHFARKLEEKKYQNQPEQSLSSTDKEDLEESFEQLNVKFCEGLIEDEQNISTEVESDENDTSAEKEKHMLMSDFLEYTEESLKKSREEHMVNLQKKVMMYTHYTQMMYMELLKKNMYKYPPVYAMEKEDKKSECEQDNLTQATSLSSDKDINNKEEGNEISQVKINDHEPMIKV